MIMCSDGQSIVEWHGAQKFRKVNVKESLGKVSLTN